MKVSPEYYDEVFAFKGEWDLESTCGLKIREVDGKTYTAYLSNVDTYNGSLNKGDSITVYYNPDDPSEVAVKTSPRVALFKIILTVISGLAALLAIYAGVTIAKRGIKISAPDASDWRVESGSAPARKVGV